MTRLGSWGPCWPPVGPGPRPQSGPLPGAGAVQPETRSPRPPCRPVNRHPRTHADPEPRPRPAYLPTRQGSRRGQVGGSFAPSHPTARHHPGTPLLTGRALAPSFLPASSPAPSGCLCAPLPPGEESGEPAPAPAPPPASSRWVTGHQPPQQPPKLALDPESPPFRTVGSHHFQPPSPALANQKHVGCRGPRLVLVKKPREAWDVRFWAEPPGGGGQGDCRRSACAGPRWGLDAADAQRSPTRPACEPPTPVGQSGPWPFLSRRSGQPRPHSARGASFPPKDPAVPSPGRLGFWGGPQALATVTADPHF